MNFSTVKNKMKKFSLLIFIIILIFSSCKPKDENVIRIGVLDGPTAISVIRLIDKPVQINGKKLEIIVKSDPQQIQALMMRHELDFAVLPTVMAANLFNRGVDYRMLACPVWGTLYIVTNNKDIKSFEDLSGRTVAVFGQGATPDVLLQREINRKGILQVKYDYSHAGNHEVAQALMQKRAEIAVVSEPLVSMLLTKNRNMHIVERLECEGFIRNSDVDIFVQSAFVVSNNFIEQHSELISEVSNAYALSCNFINKQPAEAARMLVAKGMMPDEQTAQTALPLCNIRYVSAFAIERETRRYLEIFHDFNPETTGGKTNVRDFIYQ